MANYVLGSEGEGVAQVQRWLSHWSKLLKIPLPSGFMVTGVYDSSTVTAMKALQAKLGLKPTGAWGAGTQAKAAEMAKYVSGGKSTSILSGLYKANSLAEDRAYV